MMCKDCGQLITLERLKTLPDTEVCVRCSSVQPYTEETEGLIDGADGDDLQSMNDG